MNPLLRELVKAQRLAGTPVGRSLLARLDLHETPHYWGVDWVEVDSRLYRPADGGGRVALITPVYQLGGLIDLVATSLETRAMRRRNGLGTLLGDNLRENAERYGKALRVYADGIGWIANEKNGVVILDWDNGPYEVAGAAALACETEALAVRLHRAYDNGVCSAPPIMVPGSQSPDSPHPDNKAKESRHAA